MKINIVAQTNNLPFYGDERDDEFLKLTPDETTNYSSREFDSSVTIDELFAWIKEITDEDTITVLNYCEFYEVSENPTF